MRKYQTKRTNTIIFLFFLIPVIIAAEIIRYLHGKSKTYRLRGFSKFFLKTKDNKKVAINYSGKKFDSAILLVHGYLGSTQHLVKKNRKFLEGLNVDIVALDLRNHGDSELTLPVSGGYYERFDVIAAIRWIKSKYNRYYIHASSMGVNSTIFALNDLSSEFYPHKIIFESFGIDFQQGVINTFNRYAYLPKFFAYLITLYFDLRLPEFFKRDILKELSVIKVPILVVHGSEERIYPPNMVHQFIKKHRNFITFFEIIKGGSHSELWQFPKYKDLIKTYLEAS